MFVLALLARTVYLYFWVQSPYYGVPLLDEQYHHNWALRLAQGLGYEAKPFFRAPLYPYFLGLVYRLFGSEPLAPRLVQALIGSASALLTFALAYRLFGRIPAILAGIIAALYPVWIFFDGELLLPVLLIFWNLLLAHALLSAFRTNRRRWWAAAGICGGLSAITRPNILIPLFSIGLMLIWRERKNWRRMLQLSCIYAASIFLVIAPVTLRNRIYGGDWVLIASQSGIAAYAGFGPGADGFTPRQAVIQARLGGYEDSFEQYAQNTAERMNGRAMKPSEVDRYWWRASREYISDHPMQSFKLLIRKAAGWWTRVEVRNNKLTEFALRFAPPIHVIFNIINFALIGPLALLGIFISWRKQPQSRFFIVIVLSYMASFLPFFVCDRYRLPMIPFLIVFAAWGICDLLCLVQQKHWRPMAVRISLLALAGALVWVDWFHLEPQSAAEDWFMLSICHETKGQLAEARMDLLQSIDANPVQYDALHNLGRMELQAGRLNEAENHFRRSIQAFPNYATAYNSLAVVLLKKGRKDEAIQALHHCLQLDPHNCFAQQNLSKIQPKH